VGVPLSGALRGIHVLVVEDDDDARDILQAVLTYLGAFVSTAANARTALSILGHIKADVVVCDVYLGDADALWLIRQARVHQPGTPFIALSAQDHDEDEMRRNGFSASLTKPVSHDVLVHRILGAIER
jgi:DNA-binding response OmpR family regulator